MRFYDKQSVYEASLDRIRNLFNMFPNVIVGFSGGKDSTVILHLSLIVAKELGRLPLKVLFIDQEAEWQFAVDYVRSVMSREEIEPLWLQIPIKLFNATSQDEDWLYCWDEQKKDVWMREKEPNAITENKYGTDRFGKMFGAFLQVEYPNTPSCYIAGIRCEESPTRATALSNAETYKGITWGKRWCLKKKHFTFYPIYDWTWRDVWKCIHDNELDYCKVYDYMHKLGYPQRDMRVSNLHHETATYHLEFLQEVESETWNKLVKRLKGINTVKHLTKHSNRVPKEVPFMFKDWIDYRDYLLENMIESEQNKEKFRKKFKKMEVKYEGIQCIDIMHKTQLRAVILNDYHLTTIVDWERIPRVNSFRKWKEKGIMPPGPNKYIHGYE